MEDHADLQDWELLPSPDAIPDVIPDVASVESRSGIKFDYFVVGSDEKGTGKAKGETQGSSWAEPDMDLAGYLASDELSDDQKFPDDGGEREPAVERETNTEIGFDGSEDPRDKGFGLARFEEEIEAKNGNFEEVGIREPDHSVLGAAGVEDSVQNLSESVMLEEEEEEVDFGVSELESENDKSKELGFVEPSDDSDEKRDLENIPAGNGNKSEIVWWKIPMEIVRYCVFKVRPVWSLSVAAAVLGVVMLTHKLYRMKRQSRSILLGVGIIDKKASQSVARAARLNEAFSTMRRAPLLRASLPATGITPWPAMALRI